MERLSTAVVAIASGSGVLVGSAALSAVVEQPAEKREMASARLAPAKRDVRVRVMTNRASINYRRFIAGQGMKRSGESRAEPGECRLEGVARERIRILARRHAAAQPGDGGAEDGGDENPEDRVRMRTGRKVPGVDRPLNAGGQLCLSVAYELESFPVLSDLGDGPVHEHQREILRVGLAELVDAPEGLANPAKQIGVVDRRHRSHEQQPESFFRQREEDVVLAGKIAVNRSRAVFNPLGDLPDRYVVIALGDEQIPRRIENCSRNRLPLPLLTFLDPQEPSRNCQL